MGSSFSSFFALILLFAFAVCLFHVSVADEPLCHEDERFALLKFNQSFTIDTYCSYNPSYSYPKVASWKLEEENSSNCCLWDGVECDKDTGHVISLNLADSCLYGSINSTSPLFDLVHLQWLSLGGNNFTYSKIPSGIKNLSKLSHLDLSLSSFSGQIPSQMLELSQLEYLDLSRDLDSPRLQFQQPDLRNLVEKLTKLKTLNLRWNNISSSIPNSLANLSSLTYLNLQDCQLHGTIPSWIGNLTKLVHLDISFNNFWDELPLSIGNLVALQVLEVQYCQFSGQIPSSLGNLTQLSYLYLSYNKFLDRNSSSLSWLTKLTKLTVLHLSGLNLIGEVPFSLMNLTQLEELHMSENQLDRPIPYWLKNLNHLSVLDLSANQITGQIPCQISNLTQLISLDLSSNQLQGPIPNSIVELENLEHLNLYSNSLNGTVELDMFLIKLKSLQTLVLSSNNLSVLTSVNSTVQKFSSIGWGSCNLTEFPNFLQNQDELFGLDLSSNNIPGQIPGWLLNISKSYAGLESLNLSNNLLTGFEQHPILLPWKGLDTLDLRSNKLQGSLPIPSSSILYYLASNNYLSGEIPPWICSLNQLRALDLSYNYLNGVLPRCLGNISNDLLILGLQGNNFYGNIHETFVIGLGLRMIDLSHNNLKGEIPRSLANCTSLEFLNLGYNQIIDTFPSWLGSLSELRVLILKSNKFYGVIMELGTKFEFSKLHVIDLSHNMFTGELPSKYFQSWISMKIVNECQLTYMEDQLVPDAFEADAYFDFPSYAYAFIMNNKGIEITYGKISNKLTSITLSGNRFTGEIPASISDLKALKNLNLSNNNFVGSIPPSLGNLTELESLDLSYNRLSREIPQQLAILTSLEFLDVSHNILMGRIPQGPQFNTFDNNSFEGNPGLCGKPVKEL